MIREFGSKFNGGSKEREDSGRRNSKLFKR